MSTSPPASRVSLAEMSRGGSSGALMRRGEPSPLDLADHPRLADLTECLFFSPGDGRIWLNDQRMVLMHTSSLGTLRRELIDSVGLERARGLLTRAGYESGARDAQLVRQRWPDADARATFMAGPRLHALEGVVKGPDGHPLQGATVRYTPKIDGNDWGLTWRLQRARPSLTDAEGRFRVDNVETGKLVVQFSHPKYLSTSRDDVSTDEGGTVTLTVFRELRGQERAPDLSDELAPDVAAVEKAQMPERKPANYHALKAALLADANRGLITEGEQIDNKVRILQFKPDPTPVMMATIFYYHP